MEGRDEFIAHVVPRLDHAGHFRQLSHCRAVRGPRSESILIMFKKPQLAKATLSDNDSDVEVPTDSQFETFNENYSVMLTMTREFFAQVSLVICSAASRLSSMSVSTRQALR